MRTRRRVSNARHRDASNGCAQFGIEDHYVFDVPEKRPLTDVRPRKSKHDAVVANAYDRRIAIKSTR